MEDQIGPVISPTSNRAFLAVVLTCVAGILGVLHTAHISKSENLPVEIERRMRVVETIHDKWIGDVSIVKIDNTEYLFTNARLTPLR